ncbi:MAG: hypothetical protein ACRELF_04515 [Gemmataceae bacterium]
MKNAVARLIVGTLAAWVVLVWPARLLWGAEVAPQSLAACLLCLVPSALTLAWAVRAAEGKPEQQLTAVLGGMLVRMALVLAGALVLFFNVAILHAIGFWMWVLGFYLLTLALEITLVLTGVRRASEAPRAGHGHSLADTFSPEG